MTSNHALQDETGARARHARGGGGGRVRDRHVVGVRGRPVPRLAAGPGLGALVVGLLLRVGRVRAPAAARRRARRRRGGGRAGAGGRRGVDAAGPHGRGHGARDAPHRRVPAARPRARGPGPAAPRRRPAAAPRPGPGDVRLRAGRRRPAAPARLRARVGGRRLRGNQPLCRVHYDAAALAPSSDEELAHRHAIEASRRWRGGRRDDSARTRRKI